MTYLLILKFILNLTITCIALTHQQLSKQQITKNNLFIIFYYVFKKESYSINKSKITVSGVSSGAAMASQMHIAYSSVISGSGSVAGRE